VNVATSLCSQLNAVAVVEEYEQKAKDSGLKMVLDVRDKDDNWLRNSSYFSKLSKKVAVGCDPNNGYHGIRDYAVLTNAYVFDPASYKTADAFKSAIDYLDDNFILFSDFVMGEYIGTKVPSELNGQIVVAYAANNVSTLSGFLLNEVKQKTAKSTGTIPTKNKHTVCFVLTDGDNLQYILQGFPTVGGNWFGSMDRIDKTKSIPFGWGLPPSLIDLAAPAAKYYYDNMTSKDEFVMQVSGLGYSFPSVWSSKAKLRTMAQQLNTYMGRMDMSILYMIDTGAFDDGNLKYTYNIFTEQSNIDALFYVNFSGYAYYRGKMAWSNGKPIISVRYALWDNYVKYDEGTDCDGSVEDVAKKLNEASTDPTSPDGYSLVAVYAWSGLKGGYMSSSGDSYKAARAVIEKLDSDIDVVTPSEFIRRIKYNKPGR